MTLWRHGECTSLRANKTNLKSRLNRIEGQVRAINRMIDDDVYCDDVLTQIRATRSALNSVAIKLQIIT